MTLFASSFKRSTRKRGRPCVPSERGTEKDCGTQELQYKRRVLTGDSQQGCLTHSLADILFARGHLTEPEHRIALEFFALHRQVSNILQSPHWSKVSWDSLSHSSQANILSPFPHLTDLEQECRDKKKLQTYGRLLNCLRKMGPQPHQFVIKVLLHNHLTPGLCRVLGQQKDHSLKTLGEKELYLLKKALSLMAESFEKVPVKNLEKPDFLKGYRHE